MTTMQQRRQPGSRVRSAHGLVTRSIGINILEGTYPAGATLPGDAALMSRFGVSRTALREGLKTLAAKGLIASRTKVGTRVLDESRWNMFDADILTWRLQLGIDLTFLGRLFEIRLSLEPVAAALAASRRSDVDLERLDAALAGMHRPDHDRESFTEHDLNFHRAVLDASQNPFMQSIGAVIEAALAASFTLSSPVENPSRLRQSCEQHAAIHDAIAQCDAGKAAEAMSIVILQGAQDAGLQERTLALVATRAFDRGG